MISCFELHVCCIYISLAKLVVHTAGFILTSRVGPMACAISVD